MNDHEYRNWQDETGNFDTHQHRCSSCGCDETCTDDCQPLADGRYTDELCVSCLNRLEALAA